MTKLKLNKEYAFRHLFVTLLMAGLFLWFAYDGLVRYPKTPAAELYREIEKADAPQGYDLESFKRQKTTTQQSFALLALLASLTVGLRLLKAAQFDFAFDDTSFVWRGKTFALSEIAQIDRAKWESKAILAIRTKDGTKLTLDAWHHLGVKDFERILPQG